MTIAMFGALDDLDDLVADEPDRTHVCTAHDDASDDRCCIAAAVVSAEGLE